MKPTLVRALGGELREDEMEARMWFARVWSDILSRLAPDVELPKQGGRRQAFLACVEALEPIRHAAMGVVEEAEWLRGPVFPDVMTDATKQKPDMIKARGQVYGSATRAVSGIVSDKLFWEWAEDSAKVSFSRQVRASYVYYGEPGQRCPVHIDDPQHFSWNCVVALERIDVGPGGSHSVLRLFTSEYQRDLDLKPRSAVIFHSSATAHGRTPLAHGETITLLSMGLTRKAEGR